MRKNMLRAANDQGILVDEWTQTATDAFTVSLSGKQWSAGDIIVTAVLTGDSTFSVTGMTLGKSQSYAGALRYVHMFYRVLQAGDTTFGSSGHSGGTAISNAVYRIGSFSEAQSAANISGMPDPPSTVGSAASGDLIVAIGAAWEWTLTPTAQANYTLVNYEQYSGGISGTVMQSYRTGHTGTDNPAAFGGSGDAGWGAITALFTET